MPLTQKGTHIHEPEIRLLRTPYLRVTAHPGTPIHTDGEIIATDATAIDYRILPGALRVFAPAPRPG